MIEIWISRVNKDKKVWYEWGYGIFEGEKKVKESNVHNKNGWNKCIYL